MHAYPLMRIPQCTTNDAVPGRQLFNDQHTSQINGSVTIHCLSPFSVSAGSFSAPHTQMQATYKPWQDPVNPQHAVHRLLLQVVEGKQVPAPKQVRGQGQHQTPSKKAEALSAISSDEWEDQNTDDTCMDDKSKPEVCQAAADEVIRSQPAAAQLVANNKKCQTALPTCGDGPAAQELILSQPDAVVQRIADKLGCKDVAC